MFVCYYYYHYHYYYYYYYGCVVALQLSCM